MGHPKALLPWGPSTVLDHLLGEVRSAGLANVVLVTGAHHREITRGLPSTGLLVHRNADWEAGMGSSLKSGLAFLREACPQAVSVLVLLADQPLVSAEYLKRILARSGNSPHKIIASGYGDRAGVPALFPALFWPALMELPSGKGAKGFIEAHREQALVLDPGVATMDIDTPEAYRKALAQAGLKNKCAE